MMQADLLSKCPRLPALAPRRKSRNRVDRSTLRQHVAADLFPALPPEYLARAGDVIGAHETVVVYLVCNILIRGSHNAQARIRRDFAQQKFEVIRLKRNIAVEIG